jgi:hypothetical protein
MGTRTKASKRRREDPDGAYLAAFATGRLGAKRKCTAGPKRYIEQDHESEDDEQMQDYLPIAGERNNIQPAGSKKHKYEYGSDDDVIVDEERSTPAPTLQGPAAPESGPGAESHDRILRIPLSKSVQQKLRGGRLFKEMPLEVCRLFVYYS